MQSEHSATDAKKIHIILPGEQILRAFLTSPESQGTNTRQHGFVQGLRHKSDQSYFRRLSTTQVMIGLLLLETFFIPYLQP